MMHEPIQAKGPTMSEQLMEQYRLRGQRKCRNACIAAIVTVVLVLAVAGGVWWTAGDGSALVRNMFKPKATPATQPVVNSTATFAYRTAPEFLAMEAGDRGTGNVNYSPASMWMALVIAAQGACWVETDMRAMMNPTRMRVIGEAAERFAAELARGCPVCGAFTFW